MAQYQESYGEDRPGYWEATDEDLIIFRYGDKQGNVWYDWTEHVWKCRCPVYIENNGCKHAYRYRKQETIKVRGEYL